MSFGQTSDAISSTSLCLLCTVYEILPCSGRQFQVYGTWLCHKCSSAVVVNVAFVYFKHVGWCWHFIGASHLVFGNRKVLDEKVYSLLNAQPQESPNKHQIVELSDALEEKDHLWAKEFEE
ncbi:hypothetical protein GQX74_014100 [Glossina fuscipes]|nr:hypothetical protein GQX74_014100 [Glossina fuscipes]